MESRPIQMHAAMNRIIGVIKDHAEVQARASESCCFALFVEDAREFERLCEMEQTAKHRKPLLRQELEMLGKRILLELQCIDTAYQLTGGDLDLLKNVTPPRDGTSAQFTSSALGYANAMEERKSALVDVGLHPNKFDDVRTLVARYIEVNGELWHVHLQLENVPAAAKFWMDRARRRGKLLQGELYSAMSKEKQLQWEEAASLGRVHRKSALGSGKQRALPAPAKADDAEPPVIADAPSDSLGKRTIRAVLRVLGATEGDDAAVEQPKPAVHETTGSSEGGDVKTDAGESAA
jgi:hypothetical protein